MRPWTSTSWTAIISSKFICYFIGGILTCIIQIKSHLFCKLKFLCLNCVKCGCTQSIIYGIDCCCFFVSENLFYNLFAISLGIIILNCYLVFRTLRFFASPRLRWRLFLSDMSSAGGALLGSIAGSISAFGSIIIPASVQIRFVCQSP